MVGRDIEQLAREYISDVNKACCMMLKGLRLNSKEKLIEYRQIQSSGEFYLNGSNRYLFHGRGCRFSREDLKIDWDFGCGDNYYIINENTMKRFIEFLDNEC